jgi:hypothetical protein
MPPCGNFGLLLIGSNETLEERRAIPTPARDDESAVIRETQKTVSTDLIYMHHCL